MYDIKLRYLATAFVDAQSIVPEPTENIRLQEALADDTLVAATVAEQEATGGLVERFAFRSAKEGLSLVLLGQRFDVSIGPIDRKGENMGDVRSFCARAAPLLTRALNHFQRRAHRLAIVQEGLLPALNEERLREIADRLLKLPPPFERSRPFEWIWRSASAIDRTFGTITESTNTIVTTKRISGTIGAPGVGEKEQFDRIQIDLDINTRPSNVMARFGDREVGAFFQSAPSWQAELQHEIATYLGLEVVR